MGIAFEHVQYVSDLRMALGDTSVEIQHTAPFTEREFVRSLVEPGFAGSIRYFEGDMFFEGGVSVIQTVTWKWQMRELGGSTWVDMHSEVTEEWQGGTDTGIRVGLEPAALTADADSVPLEVRLLVTASTAATISVRFGAVNDIPAMRVFGEST